MKKTIKTRLLMLLTFLLAGMSAASAADRFYIDAVNIEPGETVTLAFNLDNDQTFYGFQCDITMPQGLEIKTTAAGKADVSLSERCDASYTAVSNLLASGAMRVGAFSTSHNPISGTSGALLYLPVTAAADFASGTLSISEILFVTEGDRDVELADCAIELGTQHNNIFYIEDFTIAVGQTKTLSLILDNESAFTAFQTDIYLPQGILFADNSLATTERGSTDHKLSAKAFSDGRIRLVCFDTSNAPFAGNTGAVATFDVTATKDAAETSEIRLANNIFTMVNAHEYTLPNSTCTATIAPIPVESVKIDQLGPMVLTAGDTFQLTATVLPADATDKRVAWASSNPAAVTVDENGLIEAKAEGEAEITAQPISATHLSDTCHVSVSKASGVESITTADLKIEINGLTVTVNKADAHLYHLNGISLIPTGHNRAQTHFKAPQAGYYILQVANRSLKLHLK